MESLYLLTVYNKISYKGAQEFICHSTPQLKDTYDSKGLRHPHKQIKKRRTDLVELYDIHVFN